MYIAGARQSVTIITTDRSEPAYDGAVPHFSKIKSVWSSGDPEKIRDRISYMGMLLKNMTGRLSTKSDKGNAYLTTTVQGPAPLQGEEWVAVLPDLRDSRQCPGSTSL